MESHETKKSSNSEPKITYAKEVLTLERHADYLDHEEKLKELRASMTEGNIYIAKSVIPQQKLIRIREYLKQIGRSSLPNYQKIEKGCPNFHRINQWDERSYVKACFHQFSFFTWNQDIYNVFEVARETYQMRNVLSGLSKDSFLSPEPQKGCTARVSFQFYPQGGGGMNKHIDPYDFHQFCVPIVNMSEKGKDFQEGGAFVERADGQKIYLDDIMEIGDVAYFNAQIPHGVDLIDPSSEADWTDFKGRWMMLVAVNRLSSNTAVQDAVDLDRNRLRGSN